ncbi:MAG: polyprenyl synthetase family protein [Candidatus Eiseniibacteriota bacterium]
MPDSLARVVPAGGKMTLHEVLAAVHDDLERIEERLASIERPDVPLTAEIMEHVLARRGKRVRPLLLMLVARLGRDPDWDQVLWASTVIELVHTATLVHDDCLDGTNLRRGTPTVNHRYGEQAAILMGDYLFTTGFELLRAHGLMDALATLTRQTHRMTCGMNREYANRHDPALSPETYFRIVSEKTGTLFESSCEIGARLAGLPDETVRRLVEFGRELGLAFQIIDDVFDFTGDPDAIGKPVGTDFRLGFATLPLILALESGEQAQATRVAQLFARGGLTEAEWEECREFVLQSGGVAAARTEALSHAFAARERLTFLNGAAGVAPLIATVEFMIDRGR